jgi:hypothetical protein
MLNEARSTTLQAAGLIRSRANSNNDLPRAQFVPNMPRNCGHSRLIMVSLFLCIEGTCLARASRFSSSKLVMRVRFSSPAPHHRS